jgi:hypothetical protein
MPAEKPTPITPEGKRAAERVRSFFFLIAAANIVFVIVILLMRPNGKDRAGAAAKPAAAQEANANPAKAEERRNPVAPGK